MENTVAYIKEIKQNALLIAINVTIVYNDIDEEESIAVLKRHCKHPIGYGLTDGELLKLRAAGEVFETFVHGLRLLAYSDQSVKVLAYKLHQKGHGKMISMTASRLLSEYGYINETEQVKRRARVHASRLKGQRLIVSELYGDGYGSEVITAWADEDDTDYAALCAKAIEKKGGLPEEDDKEGKRKLTAYLYRRGFSSFDIRDALRLISEKED